MFAVGFIGFVFGFDFGLYGGWSDCGCDGLVLVLFDSCVGFYFVVLC